MSGLSLTTLSKCDDEESADPFLDDREGDGMECLLQKEVSNLFNDTMQARTHQDNSKSALSLSSTCLSAQNRATFT